MRAVLVCCLGFALLFSLPCSLAAQKQSGSEPAQPKKKKARKIWTNDDFPSGRTPAPRKPEAKKGKERKTLEQLFAELDQAREERRLLQEDLDAFREGLKDLYARRAQARTTYDREMLDLAIDAAEADIADREQRFKEVDARIAELEKLTKGRKRPQRQKKEKEPAEKPTA